MAHGRKTGGRGKGTPNKMTSSQREAISEAFERAGGVRALTRWARREPSAFYKLWSRLIPRQIDATVPDRALVVRIVREGSDGRPRP